MNSISLLGAWGSVLGMGREVFRSQMPEADCGTSHSWAVSSGRHTRKQATPQTGGGLGKGWLTNLLFHY